MAKPKPVGKRTALGTTGFILTEFGQVQAQTKAEEITANQGMDKVNEIITNYPFLIPGSVFTMLFMVRLSGVVPRDYMEITDGALLASAVKTIDQGIQTFTSEDFLESDQKDESDQNGELPFDKDEGVKI